MQLMRVYAQALVEHDDVHGGVNALLAINDVDGALAAYLDAKLFRSAGADGLARAGELSLPTATGTQLSWRSSGWRRTTRASSVSGGSGPSSLTPRRSTSRPPSGGATPLLVSSCAVLTRRPASW